jgi:hypothetical protein
VTQFDVGTHWHDAWCNPNRSLEGLYQASITAYAQRTTNTVNLIIDDETDVKYELTVELAECEP